MRSPRGFTLLEVVVAAAILGMAATALFGLLSQSLFNLGKVEEMHRYQLAAQDLMQRVLFLEFLPGAGRAEGRLDDLQSQWTVNVSRYAPPDTEVKPAEAIMKIDVEVIYPGRSGERRIKLEAVKPASLQYDPEYNFEEAIENAYPK